MVATVEGDLIGSLKAYLEELKESGVDELSFADAPPAVAAATPTEVPPAGPVQHVPAAAHAAPAAATPSSLRREGNPDARLWLVMTGPGYAGEAGGLLAKMVQAMKFKTADVCLLTFDADAAPQRDELWQAIADAGPEVVVTFGEEAAGLLLQSAEPVEKLRGKFHKVAGVAVMATLHPAQLLTDQSLKRQVWSELQQVMRRLEGYWDH